MAAVRLAGEPVFAFHLDNRVVVNLITGSVPRGVFRGRPAVTGMLTRAAWSSAVRLWRPRTNHSFAEYWRG